MIAAQNLPVGAKETVEITQMQYMRHKRLDLFALRFFFLLMVLGMMAYTFPALEFLWLLVL